MLASCGSVVLSALVPLLVSLALLLAPSSVSAQSYVPLLYPLSSCSSSTASLVSLGAADLSSVTGSASVYPANLVVSAFNNTQFGASISQLTLQLADNTAIGGPAHLRMGIYSMGAAVSDVGTPLQLLAQTDEITLFPSVAQPLYGNLLQPVQLLSGSQYAIAVWTDLEINVYLSGSPNVAGYDAYSGTYQYTQNTMPGSLTATLTPSRPSLWAAQAASTPPLCQRRHCAVATSAPTRSSTRPLRPPPTTRRCPSRRGSV